MSEQGAQLQTYNLELVKYIEHLKDKRIRLNDLIIKDEETRAKLIQEISSLEQRLHEMDASIDEKSRRRDECDRILEESEKGLEKIIESSKILLSLVQKEAASDNKLV